jgi:hypothetical protein
MMAMMLIRSGNISILAQAAIIASPTTIAIPNMLLYLYIDVFILIIIVGFINIIIINNMSVELISEQIPRLN